MRKLFGLCALLFVVCLQARADVLSGVVKTSQGERMAYVTVAALSTDSSLVAGCITDEQGDYTLTLPAGSYIIRYSYIGYAQQDLNLRLKGTQKQDVTLQEESTQLSEVEVKAHRPLIERNMDKLVFNVSASPLAAGSNGKDLLKRAPGVNVDKDGNVTVNGKGVEVYIDNRPSYLSGDQLKALLEGTDGSTIEKIEIISNPGAKYDASGTGGIINIKTKRNMMRGLNGTLSASYGGMWFGKQQGWSQQDFLSLNLNYRTEKTYTFLNLTQMYMDPVVTLETESETPLQRRTSKSQYDVAMQYYMLKLGNDWMLDKKNTLGFIFQVPILKMKQSVPFENNEGYVFSAAGDTLERSRTAIDMEIYAPQHTANLNFTHVFSDSLEREITVNVDYNRYGNRNTNTQRNRYSYFDGSTLNDGLGIHTKQNVDIYSAKLDFQTRFWRTGLLECGVKYALSRTGNSMTTDSLLNDVVVASVPSDFNYNEHVAALYATAGKRFGDHWNLKVGLRGEFTNSTGDWISADTSTTKRYFDLFPTAFVGYTTKPLGQSGQAIMFSASYSRRIKRPSYYQMNPFRTYVDAHNYSVGNTELMPEFNNDVEFNFSYSQYLSVTLNFSHTQDMQQQKTEILPNGDGRMSWQNFGTCTTHGGSISLTELPIVPKMKDGKLNGAWLTMNLTGGYFHFINRSYKKYGDYENKNHYWRMNGALTAYLPKDWVISADSWYSAPMTIGYNYTHAMYGMSAGIRKSWPKIGLIGNLQVQDLLRSSTSRVESQGLADGYHTEVFQTYNQQKISLSFTYMFGQQQWHKQRNVGNLDENSRLGGGSGTGM